MPMGALCRWVPYLPLACACWPQFKAHPLDHAAEAAEKVAKEFAAPVLRSLHSPFRTGLFIEARASVHVHHSCELARRPVGGRGSKRRCCMLLGVLSV